MNRLYVVIFGLILVVGAFTNKQGEFRWEAS